MKWKNLKSKIKALKFYLEPKIIINQGYCPICERNVTFYAQNEWLRDHFFCNQCKSIPRERALMFCINKYYPNWKYLRIHESSPTIRGASLKLKRECSNYLATQYFPDFPLGQVHKNGFRNEDLEAQTFPDESFDLIITQDVLEHIFNPERAFAEIARTLKSGGTHIFTVPLVMKDQASRPRAFKNERGIIDYILPPQYHRNPLSQEGSLVTKDWGYDIVDYIWHHSRLTTTMIVLDDLSQGIRAEYIEVLVSKKLKKSFFNN